MKTRQNRILLILALTLCLALLLPSVGAAAVYVDTYTMDRDDIYYEFYQSNLPILGVRLASGRLPYGVAMYWEDNKAYITGVPQEPGSFTALFYVSTSDAEIPVDISFGVLDAPATEKPVVTENIEITKSPTGERVEVGGTAKFVARANNSDKIVWRLVSNDTTNTVHCSDAAEYFPGLQVSGLETETLILSNIPRTLDGWRVEAQFWNGSKHAESYGAEITIVDDNGSPIRNQTQQRPAATEAPAFTFTPSVSGMDMPVDSEARTANISIQPESVQLQPGDSYTISVIATSPNNGTLSYQWYSSATNNRSAALPISGASDASFTINQTDGTAYYWVAIWNTKDGSRSQAVYSEPAEVTIVVPSTPTPVPTPVFTPAPTPTPRTLMPANINFQLVLFGIIGVLALIALIGLVIYLRADAKQAEAERGESKDNKRT